MRGWAMVWVILSAILIVPDGFSKPTYLLNCLLMNPAHQFLRMGCKGGSQVRRCGEGPCLSNKKKFGLRRNRINNAPVAENSTVPNATPETGSSIDSAGPQASDGVGSESTGDSASHDSTSGSETQGNNQSADSGSQGSTHSSAGDTGAGGEGQF
jgi:hypothetical protein